MKYILRFVNRIQDIKLYTSLRETTIYRCGCRVSELDLIFPSPSFKYFKDVHRVWKQDFVYSLPLKLLKIHCFLQSFIIIICLLYHLDAADE